MSRTRQMAILSILFVGLIGSLLSCAPLLLVSLFSDSLKQFPALLSFFLDSERGKSGSCWVLCATNAEKTMVPGLLLSGCWLHQYRIGDARLKIWWQWERLRGKRVATIRAEMCSCYIVFPTVETLLSPPTSCLWG